MTVRTRFAPSPTGDLHIGGARSALFAYLWAKKNNGQFLLRIEDTDREREVEGSVERLQEGLRWLGIEWDEGPGVGGDFGPYIQSERYDIYQHHVELLLEKGSAYRCFCTTERLDEMRKEQQQRKEAPRYDRTCRELSAETVQKNLNETIPFVVRLAVPEEGIIVVNDIVRGAVRFEAGTIDDQVLQKSDGYPTYHLANVVDDHLMGITHVIRGEEWLPSTPKHLLLYTAFEWEAPEFAHLSLFLSKEGGKMSKRHGETALLMFRENGYLSEAVVNFMALLGWNPKTEEEFFTLAELTERFDLKMINKANPVFETEKLDWMNQQYMKRLSVEELVQQMKALGQTAFLDWFEPLSSELQQSIWTSISDRSKTLIEATQVLQYVQGVSKYSPEDLIWKKSNKETTILILETLITKLRTIDESAFVAKPLEEQIIPWIADETEWGNGDVLWPMRYALSGEQKSPSPFELAEIIQKDKVIQRLESAIVTLQA